jgi:acyl-lipid omega-6 desaturase (Delta-12 desaturase)
MRAQACAINPQTSQAHKSSLRRSEVSNFAQTLPSERVKIIQKLVAILGPQGGHAGTKTMLKNQDTNTVTYPSEARGWTQSLAQYRAPSSARSTIELVMTAGPLVLLWLLMWASLDRGYWICLLLAVPAAGFLVRLFMIQHDCGHGAFFQHRLTNDWVGRVIGVLTLTPYDFWRRTHAVHHATSGNLDRRGTGDIDTLTVHEYFALSRWRRLGYRIYRHPIIMFGFGPAFLFIVQHRLPVGLMRAGWQPWLSTMATNVAIAAVVATMIWLVGVVPTLLVHLPIMLLAASVGVWLFYVQHQFEDTEWARDGVWNLQEAALHGSSYYDLPSVLRWFTANIGVHHVHHLCSRIPYYRLPLVLRDYPELGVTGRLTLVQSFRCVRLVLWDEALQRLVSFHEVRQRYALI